MFLPSWPPADEQVGLTRHARVQLYGFVVQMFLLFRYVAVLDMFDSCIRCTLLGSLHTKKKQNNCHSKKCKIWSSAPKGARHQDELAE
jgi:hypothetical protein